MDRRKNKKRKFFINPLDTHSKGVYHRRVDSVAATIKLTQKSFSYRNLFFEDMSELNKVYNNRAKYFKKSVLEYILKNYNIYINGVEYK